jgi:hypothetical protein
VIVLPTAAAQQGEYPWEVAAAAAQQGEYPWEVAAAAAAQQGEYPWEVAAAARRGGLTQGSTKGRRRRRSGR